MSIAVLILAAIVAVVALVVLLVAAQRRDAPAPPERFSQALRRRIVLHTQSGHSIDGILLGLYADGLCVTAAKFLRPGEGPVPLDGDQIVPWSSVDWIQELPHDAGATVE